MSESECEFDGASGGSNAYDVGFETREVVLACGVQFHKWDSIKSDLASWIGDAFTDNGDGTCEYANEKQGVRYLLRAVFTKNEFKDALETPDLHVIYQGHSRHGNGACFGSEPADFPPDVENVQGDHWGDGTDSSDGMYRMGKPFVCMPLEELRDNRYTFAPVATTEPKPSAGDRDVHAQGAVTAMTLPEDLRDLVMGGYESDTHEYWAVPTQQILMSAGWTGTRNDPYDLAATDLQCRCFCHFGCSSRDHFRGILRGDDYRAWQRDDPPTDHFAYFTTAPAPYHSSLWWIYYLITNEVATAGRSWVESLAETRRLTNAKIMREQRTTGWTWQIF